MNLCVTCQTETTNPKFCSSSCSAKFTNKTSPKRQRTKICKTCNAKILNHLTFCTLCCNIKYKHKGDVSLSEVIYNSHHKSSAFALVRTRARSVAKKLNWKCCIKCGYDKHIEIAHIKPIGSFSLETKLSVINNESNLLALCPNCHWEFDHSPENDYQI